jgi:outer membrane protein assembly factor BamD
MMKQSLIGLLAALLLIPACSRRITEISPELASSDEALYEMGESFIKKNPEKGRLYFRQIIDSFPKSFYAQRAKLAIADSYFEKGDEGSMIIAASEYREFITLFPYSPSAAYAQYQIAMTFYKKSLKPGRDQTKTRQALEEFRHVVTKYPMSEETENAREKIRECQDRLTSHSMTIAEHYYRVNATRAAIARLTEILTDNPDFEGMDKVYWLLADSYFKARLIEQCTPYYRKLISDFPESEYAHKAVERLEEIEHLEPVKKTH